MKNGKGNYRSFWETMEIAQSVAGLGILDNLHSIYRERYLAKAAYLQAQETLKL